MQKLNTRHKGWLKETVTTFKFMKDFVNGRILFKMAKHHIITVYGSARIKPEHPYYRQGIELGAALAQNGFAVLTGGGPGLMEAVNRGAHENNGISIGCGIKLPYEQKLNPYLTIRRLYRFFFSRKMALTRFSCGFIAMPGGYGTLDELFEMTNLVCTNHMTPFPIVLLGRDFWQPLVNYLKDTVAANGMIHEQDFSLISIVDTVEDAIRVVQGKVALQTEDMPMKELEPML